ncbi:MAG: hypothetical protein IJE89_05530 [Bacilli bacterium]|nr:hypothetical protein [Bacilli bacterium]
MPNKPKMYKGEVKKEFNNNRSIYASYSDNDNINKNYDVSEVRKKINDIFSSYDFIYRTKVNIVIDNQIITRKIIGIYENNLVTIDNEHIPINMIKDIYK